MTQLVVTLDSADYVSLISRAISQLKGVVGVTVKRSEAKKNAVATNLDLDPDLKSIMGIASSLKDVDVVDDERFTYIMKK